MFPDKKDQRSVAEMRNPYTYVLLCQRNHNWLHVYWWGQNAFFASVFHWMKLEKISHICLEPNVIAELRQGDGDEDAGCSELGEEEDWGGDGAGGVALVQHVLQRREQPEEAARHEHWVGKNTFYHSVTKLTYSSFMWFLSSWFWPMSVSRSEEHPKLAK